MEKRKQTHIAYGFITGLAMIIVMAIIEVAKLGNNKALQWLGMVIMLIGLILNAQAYSKANDADITYGQAFGSCFKATAIIALVMVAWGFIMFMVFPGMEARMLEKVEESMNAGGSEQANKALEWTQKHFKALTVAGAVFGTLIQGAICSLIAAATAKKKPRQQLTMQ